MSNANGKTFVVAIDGTLASGKGTIARRLAADYGMPHMDTGLLYRAVGAMVIEAEIDPNDEAAAAELASKVDLAEFEHLDLRTAEIGQIASKISVHPDVRAALLQRQREFAHQDGGAVMDGRDIGTIVCPEADVKLWVDADILIRAARRATELRKSGQSITDEAMLAELEERDARDRSRTVAPMKPAEDAHLLNTTHLSIDAAVEAARRIIDPARAEFVRSRETS